MRRMDRLAPIAVCVATLMSAANTAVAQQGSLQVTTAVQTLRGDPSRYGGQSPFEPDLGVSWLQPGSRFGVFQIELRGARRGDTLHTGRIYGALRDARYLGAVWTIEAGDAYFSPSIGAYGFSNLFSPAVTFNGAAVRARTDRTTLSVVAGQTTAWRNILGNDPKALGQTLGVVQSTRRIGKTVELSARGSRVRTSSLDEFTYTIDASDQAGAGARVLLTPSVQLVTEGSVVSYRRTGTTSQERDGSYLGGLSWLHPRGYLQVNASRFSPGDFPALNNPLQDREQLFAVGEYDLWRRTRVSGGWERFRTNLQPEDSLASSRPTAEMSGDRGFGAVRVQLTSRSTFAVRGEQGTRDSRPLGPGLPSSSDTGMWAAEWQAAMGRTNTFVRYSGRENVEHANRTGSYDQRDGSAQIFTNLRKGSQVFGMAVLTRTTSVDGGNTYWQAGGGTQFRMGTRDLWLRAEANAARNMDLATRLSIPRESLIFGVNGQMSRTTTIAFNINMDKAVTPAMTGGPWLARSMVRITHTLPTGSVFLPSTAAVGTSEGGRGTGTISGLIFADWNSNGVQDAGENPLEGIALRLGGGHTTSGRDGQFAFVNVPAGVRSVGLDTSALPVDFDPPSPADVQIELVRGENTRVTFGLVPLGMIQGRVVRDANGNGKADSDEQPIDGAILVLDGGLRSEQARKGRYRFDAVRSGPHLVKLLIESLPDGAAITGQAEVPTTLSRDALTVDVTFVVSVEKRPEIRRVFPPRGGSGQAAATTRPPAGRGNRPPTAPTAARSAPSPVTAGSATVSVASTDSARGSGKFTVQIAALNDPIRAKEAVEKLTATGMPAYLVSPPASDPDAPYRVRVGRYDSREEAQKAATILEAERGEKVWVTMEK
jgi:hypothetical protein